MNFAEHEHDIDPVTYRCRICGIDEIVLTMREAGYLAGEFLPGETIQQFLKRTLRDIPPDDLSGAGIV